MNWETYIHSDPNILVGKPVIKGTRLSVEFILGLFAVGWTEQQILENYPTLTPDSLKAIFAFKLLSKKSLLKTMNTKELLLQEIEKSPEPLLQEVLDFLLLTRSKHNPETRKPIWQIAQDIMANVPPEIIAQLPADGAEQHDHYIYGTPKRELY